MVMQLIEDARGDGWENVILGLGGTKDHSTYTRFVARQEISDEVLESLYVEDHFAAKIVEAKPKHALRPGWDLIRPGNPDKATKLREAYAAEEARLEVLEHMSLGACWGRLFGGAVTWIGAQDGNPTAAPLAEGEIDSVDFLHTFDRRDLQVYRTYQDPSHPRYRKPEIYEIRPRAVFAGVGLGSAIDPRSFGGPRGILVHETRCVVWPGQPTTEERRQRLQLWDDSVLERCWAALSQVAEDYGAKSLVLGKIAQAVYKLKDLYAMLAGKKEEVLARRMSLLERSRSRGRAIVLDKEEDFENIAQPLGGVPELVDRGVLRLAAAADMPVSVLMGQSPAGYGTDNANDLEVWTSEVDAWRNIVLRPRHSRIRDVLLLAKEGPTKGRIPRGVELVYRALRVPRPKEVAEVEKMRAEADALNIDRGVYTADAAAMRYAPGAAEGIAIDERVLAAKRKRTLDLAHQPPKDNAELGTVGPRTAAVMDVVERVHAGKLPRPSGLAILMEVHRHSEEAAERILGPEDFDPPKPPAPPALPAPGAGVPGPAPDAQEGQGAGAPQGAAGFNAGGAEGRDR